uniref:Guanylate kinase-like domain-containing protein n=1 Tax=Bursaphelenchus xylophilus TaxID=6326 RepID=A0A1I7RYG4_BURXY
MAGGGESELHKLRSNAESLSECLESLRQRIEQLEAKPDNQQESIRSETVHTDPVTGITKRTVVTERITRIENCHRTVRLPPSINELASNKDSALDGKDRLLGPAYQARIIAIDSEELGQVEVEPICGEFVVTKVKKPELCELIHPGDTIVEVNGQLLERKAALYGQNGSVKLKLVLSTIYAAPMKFAKIIESTKTKQPNGQILADPYQLQLNKGDIVQVLSNDSQWIQARKVNDLSRAGFIKPGLKMENVAMLCPYGRRTLAILGAPGVGRRTLKAMLLVQLPHRFSSVVPYTSRAPKPGEQEGREYNFVTKEKMREMIREKRVIEWGEYDGHIYGTSEDSVREIVRSGRVCVLDCAVQALNHLYNGEFMPYVVVIAPPEYEEFVEMLFYTVVHLRPDAKILRFQSKPQARHRAFFNNEECRLISSPRVWFITTAWLLLTFTVMSLPKSLLFPRLAQVQVIHRALQTSSVRPSGHHLEYWWGPEKAAGRVQVGHGVSGEPSYFDRLDYWYPAIRFRKEDDVITPLRSKEQGDWKNLSLEEKKTLYRYSFRQTLAEFEAPSGYWKVITALSFFVIGCATLYATFLNHFVYPELPPTFQNEFKEAEIERNLVLQKGQFLGAPKYFDYENNRWK